VKRKLVIVSLILVLAALPLMAACAKPTVEPGAAEIAALQKEIAALEKKVAAAEKGKAASEKETAALEKETAALEKEIAAAEKEIAKLEAAAPEPAEKIVWKLQDLYGPDSPQYDEVIPRMIQRISDATDGQFEIELYPPDALIGSFDVFDGIGTGVIEMAYTCAIYWAGIEPMGMLMCGLPFTYETIDQSQNLFWHLDWEDLLREEYLPHNVYLAASGAESEYGAVMSTKPIHSAADFKGLKIRSFGIYADLFDRLGASLVSIPSAEMYTGLAMGTIDAATWGGAQLFYQMKIHEVTDYYVPGICTEGCELQYIVSLDAWNEIPDSYKALLITATRMAIAESAIRLSYLDAVALNTMLDYGIQVCEFPDEEIAKMREIAMELLDECAAADAASNKAVQNLKDYMRLLGLLE